MEIISSRKYEPDYFKKILDTLTMWTDFIKNNNNFSFVKFGDGDLISIESSKNPEVLVAWGKEDCDHHPFDVNGLGQKTANAWAFFNEFKINPIYIAEWTWGPWGDYMAELVKNTQNCSVNLVNFEILLQNTLCQEKYDFFNAIKNSKRNKIFVGPKRLHDGVSRFLNVDSLVEVPLNGVIYQYDEILSNILKNTKKDTIVLFSSSRPARSLIHKTMEFENQVTCLDIGSGFDSLFYGYSREGQLQTSVVQKYYEDIL